MDGDSSVRQVEGVRQISRHALVPFSPAQMFALVDDIASYPQFLPWCRSAQVIERSADEAIARLQVHKGPLHTHFTTRNRLEPPMLIALNLVEGPFRTLEGEWRFGAIADQGTRVSLTLKFAFANPVNAWLLEPVFEHTCNSLVDAFVARARALYGRTANVAV
ncbi:MAG TPA: type II toxin-antitoxin system RatA family toxin [Steroidobacteraceae bacterium]|nr:type II toxin-antitoxin system RatA family toxin [Steroidobacteraceae bacterium]